MDFDGDRDSLQPIELVQEDIDTSPYEGVTITGINDPDGEFALILANGLAVACSGGPGGNYPWIYVPEANEAEKVAVQER